MIYFERVKKLFWSDIFTLLRKTAYKEGEETGKKDV